MRITVIAKNAGRRKELGKRPIELAKSPQTLQQLLEELTLMGLADAQAERTNLPLSQSDIDAQAEEGRVRFAEGYATNNDTPEKSLERMRQAFDDGLFRVFADGEELTQWQAPLALHDAYGPLLANDFLEVFCAPVCKQPKQTPTEETKKSIGHSWRQLNKRLNYTLYIICKPSKN